MKLTTVTNRVKKLVKSKKHSEATQAKLKNEQLADASIFAQRVEKKAYELYEQRGRQNGHEQEDWFEAEKIIEAEMIKERRSL